MPAAPTGVTATAITSGEDTGETSVGWTAPANPDAYYYNVYDAEESGTGTYTFP